MAEPVILRIFPASDVALERATRGCVAEARAEGAIEDLAAAVRASLVKAGYPAVDVRPRDAIADVTGGSQAVLYVYRDGRVRRPSPRRERLYASVGRARETLEILAETWRQSVAITEQPRRGTRGRRGDSGPGRGGPVPGAAAIDESRRPPPGG